jgi:hypothetical protein
MLGKTGLVDLPSACTVTRPIRVAMRQRTVTKRCREGAMAKSEVSSTVQTGKIVNREMILG